jgi:hypothetical protein
MAKLSIPLNALSLIMSIILIVLTLNLMWLVLAMLNTGCIVIEIYYLIKKRGSK